MFGYVKPDKAELKIKEYDSYKAVYCSLCRTLGSEYGVFAKALLTYDATFYILLLKSVFQDKPDCAEKGVCRFNPLKKCYYIGEDEILKTAAALSVIMFYYKVLDNIRDSGPLKKLGFLAVYPYIKLKFNKALKKYSYFNDIIKKSVDEQSSVEADSSSTLDLACDPSAKALGMIFSYNVNEKEKKDSLYRIGYCIGRWVYLMDAFDDIEKDIKANSFNPFVNKYSLNSSKLDGQTLNGICGSIRMTANEAADALNQLEKTCYVGIVENIIFDGTELQMNRLSEKYNKKGTAEND